MIDQLKAIAFAVLTVVAAYALAVVFGKIGGNASLFLPFDVLVYLAIGFISARALGSWRRAFVVVLIAALVDAALAVGSLILPGAPHLSIGQIVTNLTVEAGLNALIGLIGTVIGARTAAPK